MPLLRIASDLHNEKLIALVKKPTAEQIEKILYFPLPLPADKETVMILAGDLWEGIRSMKFGPAGYNWIKQMSDRFKAVIIVLGNHDLWGTTIPNFYQKYQTATQQFNNVHLLESWVKFPSVVIDGVRFVGGTLWTDMGRGNPMAVSNFDFQLGMDGRPLWNDRNYIRVGHLRKHFKAMDSMAIHRQTLKNISDEIDQGPESVCLVTHHAPLMISTADRVKNGKPGSFDHYYYGSDLSDFILDRPKIKLLVHGHTHNKMDVLIGDQARLVCNPRGYISDPVKDFDEMMLIDFPSDVNFTWPAQETDPSFG